jgi:hypothetical protein
MNNDMNMDDDMNVKKFIKLLLIVLLIDIVTAGLGLLMVSGIALLVKWIIGL